MESDGKQEQLSHKEIEKRRRDRINTCLLELSQSVPAAFSKQTSGKLEKAEILEMTVDYLRAIQATQVGLRLEHGNCFSSSIWTDFMHHYKTGYNECIKEILRYMTEIEGLAISDDRCLKLTSYLQTRFKPESSLTGGAAFSNKRNKNTSRSTPSLEQEQGPYFRYHPYMQQRFQLHNLRRYDEHSFHSSPTRSVPLIYQSPTTSVPSLNQYTNSSYNGAIIPSGES